MLEIRPGTQPNTNNLRDVKHWNAAVIIFKLLARVYDTKTAVAWYTC